MSDVMMFGTLTMPLDLAMCDELSRMQFYSRAQEAVKRIQDQEAELTELRAIVARLQQDLADADERSQVRSCQWTSAELRAEKAEAIVARLREPVSDDDLFSASSTYFVSKQSGHWPAVCLQNAINAHNKRILGETE